MDENTNLPYSMPISSMGVPVVNLDDGSCADSAPCIAVFLPENTQKPLPGVVICPGGGYGFLANDHEGLQVARWFNARGAAAFILHYRLGPVNQYPEQIREVQKAFRYVRGHAGELGLDKDRIGIMGFSAGGHLAATASTIGAESPEVRPDYTILGYPVVTMNPRYTHMGTRENLLGQNPSQELTDHVSAELQVTSGTPPTFIFHTTTDGAVPVENALFYYTALRQAGVEAELHIFSRGPHGVGLCLQDPVLGSWPDLMEKWLRLNGFLG